MKNFYLFIAIAFTSFTYAQTGLPRTVSFGSSTAEINFPTIGSSGDIVHHTNNADNTQTLAVDLFNDATDDFTATDGNTDFTITVDMTRPTTDALGNGIIDAWAGVTQDLKQTSSGLRGTLRMGTSGSTEVSVNDVRDYKITVEFESHVNITADEFLLNYNSVNTAGQVFESTAVTFLDENLTPYIAEPTFNGFYASLYTDSACTGGPATTVPTVNPNIYTGLGAGNWIAASPAVVNVSEACNPTAGTSGPLDGGSSGSSISPLTDAGLSASDRIGGFIFHVRAQDVALSTIDDGSSASETSTVTSYSSTLKGFTILSGAVLPIELIAFKAVKKNNDIHLDWSTASEINNEFYTLERSTDGIVFKEITQITGAGNSSEILNYTFIDKSIHSSGIYYYKLTQTDFDGQSQSSKFASVHFINSNSTKLLSNVVEDELKMIFEHELERELNYSIFNINGLGVLSGQLNLRASEQIIDVSNLIKGHYFIKIQSVQELKTFRFLKQ